MKNMDGGDKIMVLTIIAVALAIIISVCVGSVTGHKNIEACLKAGNPPAQCQKLNNW